MIGTEKIRLLSARQTRTAGTPLWQRVVKMLEEAGEAAAALLKKVGSANASASAEDNLPEETVDTLINCLDILYMQGYDDDMINEVIQRKCLKWERKLQARNMPGPTKM